MLQLPSAPNSYSAYCCCCRRVWTVGRLPYREPSGEVPVCPGGVLPNSIPQPTNSLRQTAASATVTTHRQQSGNDPSLTHIFFRSVLCKLRTCAGYDVYAWTLKHNRIRTLMETHSYKIYRRFKVTHLVQSYTVTNQSFSFCLFPPNKVDSTLLLYFIISR